MIGVRRAARLLASRGPEGVLLASSLRVAVCGAPALLLGYATISRVLAQTGGVPAAPLDDSYIHFQFARAFATGSPFVYSPSDPAVAGATSVLWPLLLAIPYALGLREHGIVWAAWVLGFASLAGLAWEARRMAERLCSPLTAWGAALLIYAFGPNTWFAASAMEVVPLAWILLRTARRAAEWCESSDAPDEETRRLRRELFALAIWAPLMRPEGLLATTIVCIALALRRRGRASRILALIPALGFFAPALVNLVFTGEYSTTTTRAKWLPLSPYTTPASLLQSFGEYARLLFGTLLNGKVWSALFMPEGSAPFAVLSLVAIGVQGFRTRLYARAAFLLVLALGIFIPGSFECPLCNRLRYLWPFFPAWLIGAALLAESLGEGIAKASSMVPELFGDLSSKNPIATPANPAAALICGVFVGMLGAYLRYSVSDVAESAKAISDQQVALGLWAREELPEEARIGVNDAGAIAYFSRRDTFDVVGLTTRGEARYWTAGAGSRFEHYEKLGVARLPSHFIVYPEWFALDALLGEELTARYVPGATILGGARMSAHVADYAGLGSGEHPDPALARGRTLIDRLDVADLESEAGHAYELLDATKEQNVLVSSLDEEPSGAKRRLDGGRLSRREDRFLLALEPGGAIILRVGAEAPLDLEVTLAGQHFSLPIPESPWYEARLELPPGTPRGIVRVSVTSKTGPFTALHYFSLSGSSEPNP